MVLEALTFSDSHSGSTTLSRREKSSKDVASDKLLEYFSGEKSKKTPKTIEAQYPDQVKLDAEGKDLLEKFKEGYRAMVRAAGGEREFHVRCIMEEDGVSREEAIKIYKQEKAASVERAKLQEKKLKANKNAVKFAHKRSFDPMTSVGLTYREAVRASYITGQPYITIRGKNYTMEQIRAACKEIEDKYNIDRSRFHYESRCRHKSEETGLVCNANHDGADIYDEE